MYKNWIKSSAQNSQPFANSHICHHAFINGRNQLTNQPIKLKTEFFTYEIPNRNLKNIFLIQTNGKKCEFFRLPSFNIRFICFRFTGEYILISVRIKLDFALCCRIVGVFFYSPSKSSDIWFDVNLFSFFSTLYSIFLSFSWYCISVHSKFCL